MKYSSIFVMFCIIFSSQISAESQTRSQIAGKYKWDFSPIYATWEEWEVGMGEMTRKSDEFAALKGSLKKGPKAVLHAYKLFDDIGRLQYLIYRYPQLQRDVDLRDQSISGRFQNVQAAFAKFSTATAWFAPELLTISEKKMRRWIDKTPELSAYRYPILEAYRQKAHVLDEGGEKLLSYSAQFNSTPRSIYQELSTSDINFPEVTLSSGETLKMTSGAYRRTLETAREQSDRKAAFEAHYGTYAETKNTYAAIYNGVLQRDWFSARARNYSSTLGAALDNDAVPVEVFKNLVKAVREGTEPLKKYHELRQKILKLDAYHGYDGSVPLVETEVDYPYDLAKQMVIKSVAPLGEDYQIQLENFLNGRAVDVYETEGKRSGAYVAGVYGVGPYMLLNYNKTLDAVFTLAHESGHAMHTKLSYANQPFATASYTIFVAEVASTTNERFLLEQLLDETDDPKERFLLLQKAIENIAGTFYAQVSFADYEWQAHQRAERGEPITAESLSTIYRDVAKAYRGDNVTSDELYDNLWARIPHFYNSPYYVYKYATCFASSAALYNAMTTGSEADQAAAKDRYLELLSSGGNDQPMLQLKKAGVDLSKPAAIDAVIKQMSNLVARLEVEAEKMGLVN
ncbi:MAG: oligoendopeptidase F [Candidatus Azotimanducaceae bacterium]|jgi:oligoendopeptidase F